MIGFHSAKFGLPTSFRSQVMLRHGTDRQTDNAAHFIMPPSQWGERHNTVMMMNNDDEIKMTMTKVFVEPFPVQLRQVTQ